MQITFQPLFSTKSMDAIKPYSKLMDAIAPIDHPNDTPENHRNTCDPLLARNQMDTKNWIWGKLVEIQMQSHFFSLWIKSYCTLWNCIFFKVFCAIFYGTSLKIILFLRYVRLRYFYLWYQHQLLPAAVAAVGHQLLFLVPLSKKLYFKYLL